MCSTFLSRRSVTWRWLSYPWDTQCHWRQFSWIMVWPMRRNQLRFSSLPVESPAARLSSFAKFSGATIPRTKPPGNERMIFSKTTHTYFLANPNLEDEIHLTGGRFVTSQIFNLGMLYIGRTCISYFIVFHFAILEILSNSRTLGESWGFHRFHVWILSNVETRVFYFNYFSLSKYFISKYMRGDNMTSPK